MTLADNTLLEQDKMQFSADQPIDSKTEDVFGHTRFAEVFCRYAL